MAEFTQKTFTTDEEIEEYAQTQAHAVFTQSQSYPAAEETYRRAREYAVAVARRNPMYRPESHDKISEGIAANKAHKEHNRQQAMFASPAKQAELDRQLLKEEGFAEGQGLLYHSDEDRTFKTNTRYPKYLPGPTKLRYVENPAPVEHLMQAQIGTPIGRWEYTGPYTGDTSGPDAANVRRKEFCRFQNISSVNKPGKEFIPEERLGIFLNTHADAYPRNLFQIPEGMILQKANTSVLQYEGHNLFTSFTKRGSILPPPLEIAQKLSETGDTKQINRTLYMLMLEMVYGFSFNPFDNTLTMRDPNTGVLLMKFTEKDFSENCKTYTTKDLMMEKRYTSIPEEDEEQPLSFSISFRGVSVDLCLFPKFDQRVEKWVEEHDYSSPIIDSYLNDFLLSHGINPFINDGQLHPEDVIAGSPMPPRQLDAYQRRALEEMFENFMRDGFNTDDLIQLFYFVKDVFNCQKVSMIDLSCSLCSSNEEEIAQILRKFPSAIYGGKTKKKKKSKNKKTKMYKQTRKK